MYLIYYIASSATVATVRETSFLFLQNIYFSIFKFFFYFVAMLYYLFSVALLDKYWQMWRVHMCSRMYICMYV